MTNITMTPPRQSINIGNRLLGCVEIDGSWSPQFARAYVGHLFFHRTGTKLEINLFKRNNKFFAEVIEEDNNA